ncbi:hypothetical protein YB2330_003685 [Saitoella coloradoensis]
MGREYESGPDRESRIRRLFRFLDTKHEGHLDLAGLKRGLARINHPLNHAGAILESIDQNGDGIITFQEFHDWVDESELQLWFMFKKLDKNGAGRLSLAEVKEAMHEAGCECHTDTINQLFELVDKKDDGYIDFDEWRDYLLFLPSTDAPELETVLDYFLSMEHSSSEGDVFLSEETLDGLGYFLAGGIAGAVSRTCTAPFDRLKVYLIASTGPRKTATSALKKAKLGKAMRRAFEPMAQAVKDIYRAGGARSFFVGNGLNVVKIFPESAIKFGSFEAAKRFAASVEGTDVNNISSLARFMSGGIAGAVSQISVYPIDTLKFRVQCETTKHTKPKGNELLIRTAKKMWSQNGIAGFYRGLPLGMVGIFPYASIDLGLFEGMKRYYIKQTAKRLGCDEHEVKANNMMVLAIGACSGSIGATLVYPLNLLRTRLQAQGTASHPQTYDGLIDVTRKTLQKEGYKGLYRGLAPNLMKVAPSVSISYMVYENSKVAMGLK